MNSLEIDIQLIIAIARTAGSSIMEIYTRDFDVEYKEDESPLTLADKTSNEIIVNELTKNYPGIPVLSEEGKSVPYEERKNWKKFWLIDPLDGTKEFINKNGDFTVNIALIENGQPALGVVYAPALQTLYYGDKNLGAWKIDEKEKTAPLKQKLPSNPNKKENVVTVVASRSHLSPETERFIETLKTNAEVNIVSVGSSLKLCMVAEGIADVYPRLGPTMEWDTAAAQAVAEAAGKKVLIYENDEITNQPLSYNKENLLNPWFVVTEG